MYAKYDESEKVVKIQNSQKNKWKEKTKIRVIKEIFLYNNEIAFIFIQFIFLYMHCIVNFFISSIYYFKVNARELVDTYRITPTVVEEETMTYLSVVSSMLCWRGWRRGVRCVSG